MPIGLCLRSCILAVFMLKLNSTKLFKLNMNWGGKMIKKCILPGDRPVLLWRVLKSFCQNCIL